MTSPFNAGKHPRAPGGLFAATAASQGHATGAWAAGPLKKSSGKKGQHDSRAAAAQKQLNALGVGDEHGRPLLEDGIDGAHTTAAIKRWQTSHGQAPTGELDAKAMVQLLTEKPKTKPAARERMRPHASQKRHANHTPRATAPVAAKPAAPFVDRGRGFSRTGPNAST